MRGKTIQLYDLLIIGGGPASLTAGIYGARAKLKTAILEKGAVGGMAFTTREIANYPGFPTGISGPDLMKNMAAQARAFGAEILKEEILEAELDGEIKTIKTKKGNCYEARAIILAPGSEPRMLNIPGERPLRGCGVSYCATCDAEFFEGLNVVVIGNGDAAIEEAIYITKFASKVIIIVIHDEGIVDCNRVSAEKAFVNEKIEFIWNSVLAEIKGNDEVEAVVIRNLKTGTLSEIKVEGVFIYVGMAPKTEFLRGKLDLDERGYIITNEMMETSVEGVYAAGDVREKYLRQVVTAAGDGAIAAMAAQSYLAEEVDFREKVLKADEPVVLAFWDPVVEESIAAISRLDKAAAEIGDRVSLVKVDMSRKRRIAQRYNVTEPSTTLLIKEGRVMRNLTGLLPENWINEV